MLGTVARGTRNDASSPNLCDQIVFADDAVAVLDEVDQQIKKTCGSIGTIVPREHNSRRSPSSAKSLNENSTLPPATIWISNYIEGSYR